MLRLDRYDDPFEQMRDQRDRNLMTSHKRKARLAGATIIEDVYLNQVYDRDKGICGLCKKFVNVKDRVMDHKTPIPRGGQHTHVNIHLVHRSCNSMKSDLTMEEVGCSLRPSLQCMR